MNIHSTAGNVFRPATQVGIRQKVARRGAFDLPGGNLLWKAVGKVLLWGLPLVLAGNLWCSSVIDSQRARYQTMQDSVMQLHSSSKDLQLQKKRLLSPVRVKIAAAEKLGLYEPAQGQIRRM